MSLLDQATQAFGGLPSGLSSLGDLSSVLSSFASAFNQTTRLVKLDFASGSGIAANKLLPQLLRSGSLNAQE